MKEDAEPAKLTDKIADSIVSTIREAQMMPGDTLPSEAEMCAQFGVSRTVVREALTHLSAAGIIQTGNGRKPRVSGFDPDVVAALFQHGLYVRDIATTEVMEARRGVEIEAVRLAALRRTDDDMKGLYENLEKAAAATNDRAEFARLDYDFHLRIAAATQNRVFEHLIAALRAPIQETILTSFAQRDVATAWLEKVLGDHQFIVRMLDEQKVEAAVAAITSHLDQSFSAQNRWQLRE